MAVAATTAVAVVAAGSATAATLITGKQIKNGTVASADLKNHGVKSKDLDSKVSGSLVGGRIPSGKTVRGYASLDVASTVANDFAFSVPLPGSAGKVLTDSDVNFAVDTQAESADDDAACTGSVGSPTAPAGKVCLYFDGSASDTTGLEGEGLDSRTFRLRWDDDASSSPDAFARAAWAYTAP